MAEHSIIGADIAAAEMSEVVNFVFACGTRVAIGTYMWRHLEPERLHHAVQGARLLDGETDHLVFCGLCQELLILFEELTRATSATQETKAA
jgi:hypothetical protein